MMTSLMCAALVSSALAELPRTALELEPEQLSYDQLIFRRERLEEQVPSVGGWATLLVSSSAMVVGSVAVATLFGFSGTGDVSSMAFFLIGLPLVFAAWNLSMVIFGANGLMHALEQRAAPAAELERINRELRRRF